MAHGAGERNGWNERICIKARRAKRAMRDVFGKRSKRRHQGTFGIYWIRPVYLQCSETVVLSRAHLFVKFFRSASRRALFLLVTRLVKARSEVARKVRRQLKHLGCDPMTLLEERSMCCAKARFERTSRTNNTTCEPRICFAKSTP